MAGLVDSHVHVNDPGRTDWERFDTATMAAAAGGNTTLADMPLNSIPSTTNKTNLNIKKNATQGKLVRILFPYILISNIGEKQFIFYVHYTRTFRSI